MIFLIFVGIPLICLFILIAMIYSGKSEESKHNPHYVFLENEDGEIVDSYIDKSGMHRGYLNDDEDELEDDFPGGIRLGDSDVVVTDDDDFLEEMGEDGV